MYMSYENYKGGINNRVIVQDAYGTTKSLKSKEEALKYHYSKTSKNINIRSEEDTKIKTIEEKIKKLNIFELIILLKVQGGNFNDLQKELLEKYRTVEKVESFVEFYFSNMKGKIEIPFLIIIDNKPLRSPLHLKINKELKIVEKIRELRREYPNNQIDYSFWGY